MQPLMVTTVHRGVFFGYGEPSGDSTVTLERVRMCLYWPEENKGLLGLAKDGPHAKARVGPEAPSVVIRDVTAVIGVTAEAAQRWEAAPWGK